MFIPGIIASQKNFIDSQYLIFHHKFNGTENDPPSLTDETGKSLSIDFGSPVLKSSSPSPDEGSAYLSGGTPYATLKTTNPSDDYYIGGLGVLKFKLYGADLKESGNIIRLGSGNDGIVLSHGFQDSPSFSYEIKVQWRYNGALIYSNTTFWDLQNDQWYEVSVEFYEGYIVLKLDGASPHQYNFSRQKGTSSYYLEIQTNKATGKDTYIDDVILYKGIIV